MSGLLQRGLGFAQTTEAFETRLDEKIDRTAVEAAARKFTPEFMNRLDKVVVFRTLRPEDLQQIVEIELGMVQQRILASSATKFLFHCTQSVKNFLLKEGTDLRYGARHLKRAIEKIVVFPLANLVSTGQVKVGDFIQVDLGGEDRVIFTKQPAGIMTSPEWERCEAKPAVPSLAARAASFVVTPGLL
jgi:ATP-dependent Clp protease ATP-binding subunit ClpB